MTSSLIVLRIRRSGRFTHFICVVAIFTLWCLRKLRHLLLVEYVRIDICLIKIYGSGSSRENFVTLLVALVSATGSVTVTLATVLTGMPSSIFGGWITHPHVLWLIVIWLITWKIVKDIVMLLRRLSTLIVIRWQSRWIHSRLNL